MTTVAIMQPTYLPWAGYLAMIERADVFVFLDSVQFTRRSWQQRNRIKTPAGELMLTVPVRKKGRRDQRIDEVEIDPGSRFAEKHIGAIRTNYAGAPHFETYSPALFDILASGHRLLGDLTVEIIEWLKRCIRCTTPTLRSSAMRATGTRDALLIGICREVGADTYLSAPGSQGYLDESACFPGSGVNITYHSYEHPVYAQRHGAFLPSMSAIDMLFNTGDDCRNVLMSGIRE